MKIIIPVVDAREFTHERMIDYARTEAERCGADPQSVEADGYEFWNSIYAVRYKASCKAELAR